MLLYLNRIGHDKQGNITNDVLNSNTRIHYYTKWLPKTVLCTAIFYFVKYVRTVKNGIQEMKKKTEVNNQNITSYSLVKFKFLRILS